jgi:hypothetical protein
MREGLNSYQKLARRPKRTWLDLDLDDAEALERERRFIVGQKRHSSILAPRVAAYEAGRKKAIAKGELTYLPEKAIGELHYTPKSEIARHGREWKDDYRKSLIDPKMPKY